ncbi:hypothetical protein [Xenorhabdus miraniensis]|uniref:hypothetical protein n=1 Tax=Xenorhabdus miraniensis TaxID=351674 RepID=UPI00142DC860|nr:hypothetical protein [Xenorhabdus miraniensis]
MDGIIDKNRRCLAYRGKMRKNKKVFARNIKGSFCGADKTVGGDEHRGQIGPN